MELLFRVEHVFILRGRACILTAAELTSRCRVGSEVLLRTPDGREIRTCIEGLEIMHGADAKSQPVILISKKFRKEEIPEGTEVWITDPQWTKENAALVKPYRIFVLLGILVYIGSFFLIAVKNIGSDAGFPGYWCALTTLTAPWGSEGLKQLRQGPADFFSVLFSGWINPLFLITIIVLSIKPRGRLGWAVAALLVIILPSCWVVFWRAHLRPATGYFLWTAAILVAIFSAAFVPAGQKQAA